MKLNTVLSTFVIALATTAQAAELSGVKLPDAINIGGKSLALNGIGMRSKSLLVTSVDVYVGGLYLENKSTDPSAILDSGLLKQVEMVFVRDVGADKIKDAWNSSFENHCKTFSKSDCGTVRAGFDKLNASMSDMKRGDQITFTFYPDRVEAIVKGAKSAIPGKDFSKVLLATWLGQEPPTEDLKAAMLGLGK